MKPRLYYGGQRGFTLLELVVAIGILGIIMVPILRLLNQAYFTEQTSWSKVEVLNAAQSVMEDVMAGKISEGYQPPKGYRVDVNSSDVGDVAGLKKVEVKVYPEKAPGRSVVLTAYTTKDVSYESPGDGGGQDGNPREDGFYSWLKDHTDTFNTAFIMMLMVYLAYTVFAKKVIFGLVIPDFKRAYEYIMGVLHDKFYGVDYKGVVKNADLASEVEKTYGLKGTDWEIVKRLAQLLDDMRNKWNAWFS
ncbi:type IV pilus modification PilV family protein [Caldanaerobius polysaccharolyticus]|uniref:type IV pilus modification PilV family protein n=1 Tax=Caldanaerobius polysaccharolyticus TaxID=44256 RepID=UPI000478AFB5|nr:type II secretion system protein [Caldanaerobius polysaccharolyticus]